jgi:superfamily I DNA/RNA helicase
MNLIRHDLGFSKTDRRFPGKKTCVDIYSRAVNTEAPLAEVLGANFPWCAGWENELKKLFASYVEAKQRQNVLDYDDLLLYWTQMMQEAEIARDLSSRFDHVLVDEYQDTNRLQASILLAMKPDGNGLTVVGDDAQSIYSFRAATVRNILDFPKQFTSCPHYHAGPKLPLHATDPGGRKCGHRSRCGTAQEEPAFRSPVGATPAACLGARRDGPGALCRRARSGAS